ISETGMTTTSSFRSPLPALVPLVAPLLRISFRVAIFSSCAVLSRSLVGGICYDRFTDVVEGLRRVGSLVVQKRLTCRAGSCCWGRLPPIETQPGGLSAARFVFSRKEGRSKFNRV